MALIRVFQTIDNEVWKLTFNNDVQSLNEDDRKRMQKYGEPEVNFGGTFLGETDDEFTLPARYLKVRADLPTTVEFDSRTEDFETNTQTKVLGYRTEILSRITDAFEDLRALTDTFTGEHTFNI